MAAQHLFTHTNELDMLLSQQRCRQHGWSPAIACMSCKCSKLAYYTAQTSSCVVRAQQC